MRFEPDLYPTNCIIMKMYRIIVFCIIGSLFFSCARKEEPVLIATPGLKIPFNPEKYLCKKSIAPILVDGDLNDAAWKNAPWSNSFVDIEGELKPLPTWDTKVKMLWDENYLYIAAEIIEPHIWGTLTEHDAVIFYDDDFEVFIDPDGDTHNYYEYEINALGTDWDLLLTKPYRDGSYPIDSWEIPGIKKGVKIYGTLNNPADLDEKWTVELAFPWEVLRECNAGQKIPKPGDQWRIGFSRVDWTMVIEDNKYVKKKDENGKVLPEDNWIWSPQGVINMHRPETWGYLQFVDNDTDTFVEHADEKVKWALRQVYYREHAYFAENQTFTNNLSSLRLHEVTLNDNPFEPEIKLIASGFIASYPSIERDGVWYIESDGLVKFAR